MMERSMIVHPDGTVTLLGNGPAGAVSLDAWTYRGQPQGLLGVHLAHSRDEEGHGLTECAYLEGGLCYCSTSSVAGMEAAPLVIEGREDEAWAVVGQWYRSHVEGQEN